MKRKEGRYIHVHAHIYLFAYQYICKYKSIWSIINAYKKYIKTLLFLDHGTVSDLKHLCILFCGVSRVSHNNITFFRAQCSQWIAGLILQSEKKMFGTTRKSGKNVQDWSYDKSDPFSPLFSESINQSVMTLPMIFISASKQ